MLYTITEMRRYYFIWYEKKFKEKGISVVLLMPQLFFEKSFYNFFAFFTLSFINAASITSLISFT